MAIDEINQLVHSGETALIRIGTNLADTDYLMAKLLTDFHTNYPSVSIDYCYYNNLEEVLEKGEIDIAIGILSETNPKIMSDLILSESYVLFISNNNKFSDLDEVSAEHLLQIPLINYSNQIYEKIVIDSWIETAHPKLKYNHHYELPSTISILNLVDQDFGVALLPYSLTDSLPNYLNVNSVEIIDGPFRNISIGYASSFTRSKTHDYLIKQLQFIF